MKVNGSKSLIFHQINYRDSNPHPGCIQFIDELNFGVAATTLPFNNSSQENSVRAFKILLSLFVLSALHAHAENWPHWRGPAFNGSSTETGLPSTWNRGEGG